MPSSGLFILMSIQKFGRLRCFIELKILPKSGDSVIPWAEGLHRAVYFAELIIDLLKQVWPVRVAAR